MQYLPRRNSSLLGEGHLDDDHHHQDHQDDQDDDHNDHCQWNYDDDPGWTDVMMVVMLIIIS